MWHLTESLPGSRWFTNGASQIARRMLILVIYHQRQVPPGSVTTAALPCRTVQLKSQRLTGIKHLGHSQHFTWSLWELKTEHTQSPELSNKNRQQKNYQSCQVPIKPNLTASKTATAASGWIWHVKGRVKGKLERNGRGRNRAELTARKKGRREWEERDLRLAASRRDVFLPLPSLEPLLPLRGSGTGKTARKLRLVCHGFPSAPCFPCSWKHVRARHQKRCIGLSKTSCTSLLLRRTM